MGYASDLGTSTVARICPKTGFPMDEDGHLLRTLDLHDGAPIENWDTPGTELPNFTSPYGHLHYAVGSGDDFHCFDFQVIDAGPRGRFAILHAVINSETGSFIEGAGYEVLPCNTLAEEALVVGAAFGMVDAAQEWCDDNSIRHSTSGWNQNPHYFALAVAQELRAWRFKGKDGKTLALRKNNRKALGIAMAIAFGDKVQGVAA